MNSAGHRLGTGVLGTASAVLLALAAAAWVTVVAMSNHMSAMSGTMNLDMVAFVVVWALMMAAMMLPGVAPVASFYTATFTEHRAGRMLAFASGYLLLWAAIGVPAFGLAWMADHIATDHGSAATALAALVFVACGVYQLTPVKDRCLALCRSPLGFTLRFGTYRGRARDVRAGVFHGAFCAGCCWALMLVLLAFGLMNVAAMIAIAAVVVIEKTSRRGVGFARAVGVLALLLAVVVVVHPAIAPGLHSTNSPMTKGAM